MSETKRSLTAAVLGATGLVGGCCVDALLRDDDFARVITLGRRTLPRQHAKLDQRVVEPGPHLDWTPLGKVDAVFCCLGTTIAKAGSQEAFRRVDFDMVVDSARGASAHGVRRFLLVSSLGADPASRVFYNRVKGETEDAVRRLAFDALAIFRPSLLLGDRPESRRGERIAAALARPLAPLLSGRLRRYRPIRASTVAAAMVHLAKAAPAGATVFESDQIAAIAEGLTP